MTIKPMITKTAEYFRKPAHPLILAAVFFANATVFWSGLFSREYFHSGLFALNIGLSLFYVRHYWFIYRKTHRNHNNHDRQN